MPTSNSVRVSRILKLGLALGVFASHSAHAGLSSKENAARLKQILSGAESKLTMSDVNFGLWYRANKKTAKLSLRPSDTQIEQEAKKNAVLFLLQKQFVEKHGLKNTYAFDEVDAAQDFSLPPAPAHAEVTDADHPAGPPQVPPGRFFLRRSLTKVPSALREDSFGEDTSGSAQKLAEGGALFSYGRDFSTSTDQWSAEGVFAYERPVLYRTFGLPSFGRFLLFGEFSRLDLGGDTTRDIKELKRKTISKQFSDESNSLKLGVTFEGMINWPTLGALEGSIVRVTASEHTDFDFESQIPTAELEWEPIAGKFGMGSVNTMWDPLWWRLSVALHADLTYVATDGEWTKSVQGQTAAHLGPKVALTLIPFPKVPFFTKNPLVITGSFSQLERLNSESNEQQVAALDGAMFLHQPSAEASGLLDPSVALTVSFKDYRNIENETDDRVLVLGLGVGF